MPDAQLPALKTYLKQGAAFWSDDELEGALVAERSAQARRCKVPATDVPPDLTEGLFRRVARNLVLRGLPLGLQASTSETVIAVTKIGDDVEIRRLEGPYRKRVIG